MTHLMFAAVPRGPDRPLRIFENDYFFIPQKAHTSIQGAFFARQQ
jgi:hypothetical protein